jgi:hypothetical protein
MVTILFPREAGEIDLTIERVDITERNMNKRASSDPTMEVKGYFKKFYRCTLIAEYETMSYIR